jgi:beta-galactosidase GanA
MQQIHIHPNNKGQPFHRIYKKTIENQRYKLLKQQKDVKMKTFNLQNNFVYGSQYYRAPTPLPDEWEYDMEKMEDAGIDTIQFRIQWRWNERIEDQYTFDDIDRLFELSEKYKKKVIIKFLMENAPDYIFHKYHGYRKDMHGNPMNPGAHCAFYIGGWIPCFDNPKVIERAKKFVSVFVDRYKNKKNLILWNIWNEPRSRPIGECGCKHSINAYRKWLSEEYESIENLNEFYQKKWESFDTVIPPSMPTDFVELFLWRKWAASAVKDRVKFMYKTVKLLDNSRPVITHVGFCTALQDAAGDTSDDFQNAAEVDFYGCSYPTAEHFTNIIEEAEPFIQCDWIRSISEYFWVYELYPDWGAWHRKISVEDYNFKVWSVLASGAKGLLYWQYRAERVGAEHNLAGLVNIDGSFKEISHESKEISNFIKENNSFLANAKVRHDKIGILYSIESDLINRIENTGDTSFFNFDLNCESPYTYKRALIGIYTLFKELGYTVKLIDERNLETQINDLQMLYIPECFMISNKTVDILEEFKNSGGYLIAEEGIGLRQKNTWVHSTWPSKKVSELFGVKIEERVSCQLTKDEITIFNKTIPASGFISYLKGNTSTPIGSWSDNRVAAAQKDNCIFIGTSLGEIFYNNYKNNYDDIKEVIIELLKKCNISVKNYPQNVYIRTLVSGNSKLLFIFNRSNKEHKIQIDKEYIKVKPKEVRTLFI